MLKEDEQDEVAAGEIGGGGDDLRAAGGIGELCDPDDEAAAALQGLEAGGGVEVVGLGGFSAGLRELIVSAQVLRACGR